VSILDRAREALEGRAVQRRADIAFARVQETIASQLAQELTEEDNGWRKLTEGAGTYDLTPGELADIRAKCIKAWQIDPSLGQAASLLVSGAFGKGLDTPRAADSRVQEVVDRLWDDEDNRLALFSRDAMARTSNALMLEGERFLAVHTSVTESRVKLSELPCAEVVEVVTAPENALKPVLYRREFRERAYNVAAGRYETGAKRVVHYADWRCWRYVLDPTFDADSPDWEEGVGELLGAAGILEASGSLPFCYHVKGNTLGLRGIPEAYRAYDWIRSHARTLSDLVTLSKALAMFAWRKKLNTKSATAIENAAKMFRTPPSGPAGVQVENQNVSLDAINVPTGGVGNLEVASRQTHLQSIRAFGFGEHWFSDASTGNLATASAMDMPAIWKIEERQQAIGEVCEDLTKLAIELCVIAGDFPSRRLPTRVDRAFDLDFPAPQPRNENVLGIFLNALTTAADKGLIDKREAAYQAYTALGSNDVTELLERQFPTEDKLDGQAPTVEPGAEPEPPTPDEPTNEEQIAEARAQEAVPPFQPR
jgi:hypothetical protein